jgi:uncharacterized phage-like protein YoqJ
VIAAITGHRPKDLPDLNWVESALTDAYAELKADHVIQGMAAGVDLIAAKAAYKSGIPYTCAKPWANHKGRMAGSAGFTDSWNTYYDNALRYAAKIVDVNPTNSYPGPWIYQERNEWMVNHADILIAVWTGKKKGGTYNCVKYAMKAGVEIYHLDPTAQTSGWYDGKTV